MNLNERAATLAMALDYKPIGPFPAFSVTLDLAVDLAIQLASRKTPSPDQLHLPPPNPTSPANPPQWRHERVKACVLRRQRVLAGAWGWWLWWGRAGREISGKRIESDR